IASSILAGRGNLGDQQLLRIHWWSASVHDGHCHQKEAVILARSKVFMSEASKNNCGLATYVEGYHLKHAYL
ncbi:unnamed protein product, partial [Musa acuminata subsp. burmannicoides]